MEFGGCAWYCELPAPLFAVVSSVMVPTAIAFLPEVLINHVERNTSEAAAGVGLGDGAGLGVGVGDPIGVGVGVGPGVLLETEPHPASNNKSPENKTNTYVRKGPPKMSRFLEGERMQIRRAPAETGLPLAPSRSER